MHEGTSLLSPKQLYQLNVSGRSRKLNGEMKMDSEETRTHRT